MEKDLSPRHTSSRGPSPAGFPPADPQAHHYTCTYICTRPHKKITGIHESPCIRADATTYVYSPGNLFTPMRHTAFQYSCIPRILHIISLSPTGNTPRFRCVTALSHSQPSMRACIQIPSQQKNINSTQISQLQGLTHTLCCHTCAQVQPVCASFLQCPTVVFTAQTSENPIPHFMCSQFPQTHTSAQPQLLQYMHRCSEVEVSTCSPITHRHTNSKHSDKLKSILSYLQ